MERTSDFEIGLFECGDWRSCLCAWVCCPCALASARSHLDDSSYAFNIVCLPVCCITPVRWMIRTAYDIPGDSLGDFCRSTFCPCCVLNQLLQTAFARGNSTMVGGSNHNVRDFSFYFGTCSDDCRSCLYSNICCPCAVGSSLQTALGMPFVMGCCCMTPCAARNVLRYQYRLRGDDVMEEFCGPVAGVVALYGLFVTPLIVLPILSSYSSQVYNEALYRGRSAEPKYLVALSPLRRRPPPLSQPTASDLSRAALALAADVGETGSEVSSAFTGTGTQETGVDKGADGGDADVDESSPLLLEGGRPSGTGSKPSRRAVAAASSLGAIPEGTAIDSISALAAQPTLPRGSRSKASAFASTGEGVGVGYAVAKVASRKDIRKNYTEAEAVAAVKR